MRYTTNLMILLWFQTADVDHGPSETGVIIPVLVTVFYEALCPDSKSFITKHLLPIMERGSRLVTVSLVPYGKAKVSIFYLTINISHLPLAMTVQFCFVLDFFLLLPVLVTWFCLVLDYLRFIISSKNVRSQYSD